MMTFWAVPDASIVLSTLLPQPATPKAVALLNQWHSQEVRLVAPTLMRYETINAIRRQVAAAIISNERGGELLDAVLALPIRYISSRALVRRGYELSGLIGLTKAYDSQFLAVAERFDCDFWTNDQALYRAASTHFPWVKWLGDLRES
jgi:predicted nucleic acid-binding protein